LAALVIGYGNDLRCDDGAGRAVADRIEAMNLPEVEVRSVMQLTPELALDIARAQRVFFVDASVDVSETTICHVDARPLEASLSHHNTPGSLLEMTASVGRAPADAFTIEIPVTELGLGMELTPATELGVDAAVSMILDFIGEATSA
jgi:hydrogenase maturation protease